ncbi:DUF4479 family protein [Alkalibacterium psychrotolerans]
MFISTYNNNGLDDVLMIMLSKADSANQVFEKKKNMTVIKEKSAGDIVGLNLFNASAVLNDLKEGPQILSDRDRDTLNQLLKDMDIDVALDDQGGSKFVVGYVSSCEPVEGSDHLNLTQTEVEDGKVLQIVCGAGNIAKGQKVVVAKPGAVLPDGLVIWPGELKGIKSEGMICSARELGLPQETAGIMVLDEDKETGVPFTF